MLQKLLYLLLLVIYSYSYNNYNIDLLNKVYKESSEFNLGLTMGAILIQESDLGKYRLRINKDSIDCGIFQINSKTLANNNWTQSRVCERLFRDDDFSLIVALKRFKYFYNFYRSKGLSRNKSWRRAVMSYHSGWNYKLGKRYLNSILKNMKLVKKLIKRNKHDK